MLIKTIEAKDFFTKEKYTTTVYFNLTKTEIAELDMGESQIALDGEITGGLEEKLSAIRAGGKGSEILQAFKDILFLAYGERDPEDPRRLAKSAERSRNFSQTPVYDKFFEELISDPANSAKMINAMLPEGWNDEKDKAKSDKPDADRRPTAPLTTEITSDSGDRKVEIHQTDSVEAPKVLGKVRRDESKPAGVTDEQWEAFQKFEASQKNDSGE